MTCTRTCFNRVVNEFPQVGSLYEAYINSCGRNEFREECRDPVEVILGPCKGGCSNLVLLRLDILVDETIEVYGVFPYPWSSLRSGHEMDTPPAS
jgi:hypothetical protein